MPGITPTQKGHDRKSEKRLHLHMNKHSPRRAPVWPDRQGLIGGFRQSSRRASSLLLYGRYMRSQIYRTCDHKSNAIQETLKCFIARVLQGICTINCITLHPFKGKQTFSVSFIKLLLTPGRVAQSGPPTGSHLDSSAVRLPAEVVI